MDAGKLRALTNFINAISIGPCIESLKQLHDGSHFIEMMQILNGSKPRQDSDHPIQRYRQILNFLEDFYSTELKFHVDCSRIVNTADEGELAKVAALMLCASVQGDEEKVKLFVEPITKLDFTSQNEIKDIIEFVVDMEANTSQLRRNFADILHRRASQNSDDDIVQEMFEAIDTDVRGESVSSEISTDSTASTIKTPVEPSSPFQKVYHASPLSPVKALLTSPHMANKINLRKMHKKIRQLETKNASERALRDDLESEVVEKNKQIAELKSQLNEMNSRLQGNKELQDRVDELQAKQEEFERENVQLQKLKSRLSELGAIKEERSRLDKENKEFAAESSKLRSCASKYQRLKGEHEAVQKALRQAHQEIADQEASIHQLNTDLASSRDKFSEASEMLKSCQEIFKEKVLQLEQELAAKSSTDHLGESLGIITEKRIADLEAELANLRATWAEPQAHKALKDKLSQMKQANDTAESKIRSLEVLLDQERWASNEKLSALRSEAVSIRKEYETANKNLQTKLESAQHLTVSLRADVKKANDGLERERQTSAEKLRALEAEKETLFESWNAESESVRSLTERHRLETESWEKTRQDLKDSISKLREVQSQEKTTSQERIASLENTLKVELERMRSDKEGLQTSLEAQRTELLFEKDSVERDLKEKQTELMKLLQESREDVVKAQMEVTSLREDAIRKVEEAREDSDRKLAKLAEDYQSELISLEKARDELKKELEHSEASRGAEKIASGEKTAELQSRCNSLAVDLERAEKENAALEASLASDKQEMFAERGKLVKEMEAREDNLRRELEEVKQSLNAAKIEQDQWKITKERMEGEAQQLSKVTEEQGGKIQQLQDAVDSLQAEKNRLDSEIVHSREDFESQTTKKEEKISRLEEELRLAEDKIQKNADMHSETEKKLQERVSSSVRRVGELTENLREAMVMTEERERQVIEITAAKTQTELRLQQEKVSLEERLMEVESKTEAQLLEKDKQFEELGEKLKEAHSRELQNAIKEKMELESKMTGEKAALEERLSLLEVQITNNEKTREEEKMQLEHENDNLKLRVNVLEREQELFQKSSQVAEENAANLDRVVRERMELESKMTGEKAALEERLSLLEAQITNNEKTSEEEKMQLRHENDNLKIRVNVLAKEQELFQKSSQVTEENAANLDRVVRERVELESRLAREKMEMEGRITELNRQIEEEKQLSGGERRRLETENQDLKLHLDKLEKQRDLCVKDSETAQANLEKVIKQQMEQDRLVGEQRRMTEAEITKLTSEKEDLKLQVDSLREKQGSYAKSNEASEEDLRTIIEQQKKQEERIKEQIKSSEAEMTKLQKENEDLKLHVTSLEQKQESDSKIIKMAEENLNKMSEEKREHDRQAEEQRRKAELEAMKLKSENEDLQRQVISLDREQEEYQRSSQEQLESRLSARQSSHSEEVERLEAEKKQLTERMNKLMEMNRKYREGEKKAARAKDEALREYKGEVEAEFGKVKQRYEAELEKVKASEEARHSTLRQELETVSRELGHTKEMLSLKDDELRNKSELLASTTESLKLSRRGTDEELTTLRTSLEKEKKATRRQVEKLKTELVSVKTESCNLQRRMEDEAQRKLEEAEKKMAVDREELQAKIRDLEEEKEALHTQMKTMEKMLGPVKGREGRNSSLSVNLSANIPNGDRAYSDVFVDSLTEEHSPGGRGDSDSSAIGTPSQRLGKNMSELRLDDLSTSPMLAASRGSNRSLRSSTSSTRSRGRTTIEIHMSSTSSETEPTQSLRTSLPSASSQLDLPETVTKTLDELCASQNSLASTLPQNKSHHTTGRANFVIVNDCDEEPEFLPWEDRIQELHRRNTLCHPHMRTSYPVETQGCDPQEFKEEEIKTKETTFSNGETKTTTTAVTTRKSSRKRKPDLATIDDAPIDKLRKATSHDTIPSGGQTTAGNLRKAVSHQEMPPPDAIPHHNPSSSKAAKKFLVSSSASSGRMLRSSDLRSSGRTPTSQPLKPEQKAMAFDIGFSPKPSLRRRSMRHSFAKKALGRNSPKVNPEAGKENRGEEDQLLPPAGRKKSKRRSLGKWLGK